MGFVSISAFDASFSGGGGGGWHGRLGFSVLGFRVEVFRISPAPEYNCWAPPLIFHNDPQMTTA